MKKKTEFILMAILILVLLVAFNWIKNKQNEESELTVNMDVVTVECVWNNTGKEFQIMVPAEMSENEKFEYYTSFCDEMASQSVENVK